MGGLILKLRPHEELMINGVLVENGERNTRLRVKTVGAHILRLRDALKPEEATTPTKRAYYIAGAEAATILGDVILDIAGLPAGVDLGGFIARHEFYQVMRALRDLALVDREAAHEN